MNLTLRTKGILALAVLILYIASISWFLAYARQELYLIVQQIETNYSKQALLAPTFRTLAHTLVETQAILSLPKDSANRALAYEQVATHMQPIRAGLDEAQKVYPLLTQDIADLEQAIAGVRTQPSDRRLAEVRDGEQKLIAKLHDILNALQERSAELAQSYHNRQQYISVIAVSANIAGAVASIAVILVFFTRLAKDIKRLQDRAMAVVAGYDGAPLVNTRRDEIGGLINAVNRMQVDLRRWEQQQEVTRQQRVHQEKMAAVGSLAAAIGHEVSNPIAAISGVAQAMIDEIKDDSDEKSRVLHDFAAQILKQTERIALIMRQMATLTTPHSPEPELLDLNALVQSTCGFIAYDKRFRGIEFELDLDQSIPAITAIADHITQILMNLLINAADAMDHLVEAGRSKIRISTRLAGGEIHVSVADTGHGMSAEVLARAFQESFTTKPAGKGRGIGLYLCKTLIEEGGGRIELASTQGVGTTAKLFLPLSANDKAAA
jgi:two-component system NtrC family sensor kinase